MALLRQNNDRTSVEHRPTSALDEASATRPDLDAPAAPQPDPQQPIERLLFVADAAVAGADELPPQVRAIIGAAAEVYVVTPTLPGRLAWLADDVDGFRHTADERLDTVLGQMRSIRGEVSGDALRGSVMTVITDGVETFRPDHILLALRSSAHANWQEHGLVEHTGSRAGLKALYSDDRKRAAVAAGIGAYLYTCWRRSCCRSAQVRAKCRPSRARAAPTCWRCQPRPSNGCAAGIRTG